MSLSIGEGRDWPLGATLTDSGVNFAIYSRDARDVHLLLFAASPNEELTDIVPLSRTHSVWHCHVNDLRAGQLYGYRVNGDYAPRAGYRFNPNKLLIDPYAKAINRKATNVDGLLCGYAPGTSEGDLGFDTRNNFAVVPKCVVVDNRFDWQGDAPPGISWNRLIIYETHLKGFTAHRSSGVRNAGTYLGFVRKIRHLTELGVNAVQFLPIQESFTADYLTQRGLKDYWGYSTIGFFAPESSYGTGSYPGSQVHEFKTLVRELHRSGIEVIVSMAFSFTAEGNELGPTLSFRGIDNRTYYLLTGDDDAPKRHYEDFTGAGSTLDFSSPYVMRFVLDALRYWVEVMHVDGLMLEAPPGLAAYDRFGAAAFFAAAYQDPVLRRVKLIAEPWSVSGYFAGQFPDGWYEWNGGFRDAARSFFKGDVDGRAEQTGQRLVGSIDVFGSNDRLARGGVNFITCHDGFTLNDLVTYNSKQNEANGDQNKDGINDNQSWNCGYEGPTDDPVIVRLRGQQMKNLICLLMLSIGTPMILGGDEMSRTQRGNNNAYCQDNEISWFDWERGDQYKNHLTFIRKAVAFRKRLKGFERGTQQQNSSAEPDGVPPVALFGRDGHLLQQMEEGVRTVALRLAFDDIVFVIFNGYYDLQRVELPPLAAGTEWCRVIDTSLPEGEDFAEPGDEVPLNPGDHYLVNPRSTVALLAKPATADRSD